MVFVIKYRKTVITPEIFDELKVIFNEISERFYFRFHAIGTDRDHLHILVEAAPSYSPSTVMQYCKSITAKEIFKKFPEVIMDLWGGHFWSAGGHIDTIGDGYDVKHMEEYIKNQGAPKEQIALFQFKHTGKR
jgi:putative transposase